jgi:hypothetical protein
MKADDLTVQSYYSDYVNNAAECCNHIEFIERLFGKEIVSGQIVSRFWICKYCKKPLVFGYIKNGESIKKCALNHVGKIASLLNRPVRLKRKFGVRFQEVGKKYYVRVFKGVYRKEADYYIVSFEEPEMIGSFFHFSQESRFLKYFEFVDMNYINSKI